MTDANIGMLSSEVVTVSYHNSTAMSASENETVFTISFIATKDGQLSEMIDVTSKVTNAEAYVSPALITNTTSSNSDLEIRDVIISSRDGITASAVNNLYQNEPNPFKDQTMIKYELAEAGQVIFTVTDAVGKVLHSLTTEGSQGMNAITLNAKDLGTTGVLYYSIESGDFTETKKMIVVR